MRRSARWLAGAVSVLMATWPAAAPAQSITTVSDLSFGTILAGLTTNVSPFDADAAQWKITGLVRLLNQVTFTLPTTLTRDGGGGSMPITFCTTCGAYNTSMSTSGAITFNPNASYTIWLTLLSPVYIWLGGAVSPPLNQPAGTYSGSVIITIAGIGL